MANIEHKSVQTTPKFTIPMKNTTFVRYRRLALKSLALVCVCAAGLAQSQPATAMVGVDEARRALESGSAKVFDIRERAEFATGVAPGMLLLPMSELGKRLTELPAPGAEPFLLICNTQNRSSRVVQRLQAMGYTNVQYVNQGMSEWAKRGWPMVKP